MNQTGRFDRICRKRVAKRIIIWYSKGMTNRNSNIFRMGGLQETGMRRFKVVEVKYDEMSVLW